MMTDMNDSWTAHAMRLVLNYGQRCIGRVMPEGDDGVGVSTCWVDDISCFETALLSSFTENAHPVERCETHEDAVKMHERWVDQAKTVKTVTELGTPDREGQDTLVQIRP